MSFWLPPVLLLTNQAVEQRLALARSFFVLTFQALGHLKVVLASVLTWMATVQMTARTWVKTARYRHVSKVRSAVDMVNGLSQKRRVLVLLAPAPEDGLGTSATLHQR
jgi:hypothetical protein